MAISHDSHYVVRTSTATALILCRFYYLFLVHYIPIRTKHNCVSTNHSLPHDLYVMDVLEKVKDDLQCYPRYYARLQSSERETRIRDTTDILYPNRCPKRKIHVNVHCTAQQDQLKGIEKKDDMKS